MTEEGKESSPPKKGNRLWTETDGAERYLREQRRREEEFNRLVSGLVKCKVCGGAAKVQRFGRKGEGVWVGCDRTNECSRYIEIHTEGWSLEDTARDWNRRNSGMYGAIRRVKRWWRLHFGKMARAERREKRAKEEEKKAKRLRMMELLGIKMPKKAKKWWKVW